MQKRFAVLLLTTMALGGCTAVDEATEEHPVHAPGQAGFQVVPYPGETIESVAQRFEVSKDVLIQANHLKFPYIFQPHQVLIVPPPADYRVRAGDTVAGIATTLGVDEAALAQVNGLQRPYHMRVGQILRVPGGVGGEIAAAPPAEPGFTGVAPVPRSAISKESLPPPPGASSAIGTAPFTPPPQSFPQPQAPLPPPPQQQSFAAPPTRTSPTALAPQTPPPPSRNDRTAAAAAVASAAPTAIIPAESPASAPPQAAASLAPPPAAAAVEGAVSGAPHFIKPVGGQIIEGFGAGAAGQTNDGVNIAAAAGTPVKAADAGTVIYTGNELAAFGNLILVRHAGGFVTAYGHLATIGVQRGQTVTQGQTLGTVGQTGSATTPQLHFEIRQGSKPVDPAPYLNGAKG